MPKFLTFWMVSLLFFGVPLHLWAQNPATLAEKQLEIPIFLTPGSQTIGGVLDSLNREYRINFSYVNSQIPLEDMVEIQEESYRLDSLLSLIFSNKQVKFFPVYDQIILVKRKDIDFVLDTQVDSLGKLSNTLSVIPLFESKGGSFQIKTSELLNELAKLYAREKPLIDKLLSQNADSTELGSEETDPILEEDVKGNENFKTYRKVRKPVQKSFAWGPRFNPGAQLWRGRIEATPDTVIRARNQYGSPDWAWGLGLWAMVTQNKWNFSLGLEYQFQQKRGKHLEYFINTIYAEQLQQNTISYSEHYHNLRIPIQLGFTDLDYRFKWYFHLGAFVSYRFSRSERGNFSIYRDQFFSNLSINSTQDADLSPFFDANLEEIQHIPKQARPWSGGFSVSMGRNIAWGEKHIIQLGPEFSMHVWSLYGPDSPIREYPIKIGLHVLVLKK